MPGGLDRLQRLLRKFGILANRASGFGTDYAACSGHDLGLERGGLDAGADSGKLESYGDVMKLFLYLRRISLATAGTVCGSQPFARSYKRKPQISGCFTGGKE